MTHSLSLLLQVADPQLPPSPGMFILFGLIKAVVAFGIYMLCVAYTTLLERRLAGFIQDRIGPNRVGPQGLLQPIADGLKNFMKEETLPGSANKVMFVLAPAFAFIPAMITWAVIPFGAPLPIPGVGLISMAVADLPVGFLFTLAISSLGVYGITIAGWSSNNKYALLGGLRARRMSALTVLLVSQPVGLAGR